MLYPKLWKNWCLIIIASFFIYSCEKEEAEVNVNDDIVANQFVTPQNNNGGPNNGNGNGGNENNGNGNGGNGNGQMADDADELDSDIIVEWNDLFLELDRYATGMRPNATARAIAYINLAAYETVVPAMDGFISNNSLLPGLEIQLPNTGNIDLELALNACYADVLGHFLLNLPNNQRRKIGQLEEALEETLEGGQSRQSVRNSINWGESVAEQIIAYSQTDTQAEQQIQDPQPHSYVPPVADGYWTFSAEPERALFPYWEHVRTFTIAPNQTTTVPPIAYSENPNSAYYQQMKEVYDSNNQAREEDGEALWIAEFWSDDVEGLMFSPPARQVSIANQLIVQHDMNMQDALHLLLKLGFSLNDAAVATWKYKYEYMVMRPSVFIQQFIDPSYQTNLFRLIPWPNPSFPGYPSGHSAFASAAAGVFINFFGNATNFTDRSHEGRTEFRGDPRTFSSFEDMAAENGYSRLPLGVHIQIDCTEGLRLGYEIATAANQHSVQQTGE